MGMFDNYQPFEDHFKPGDKFVLQGLKLGAMLNTNFGPSQQVLVKVNDTVYSALGSGFVQQTQRMEKGDLPREVAYCVQPTKTSGNKVKLFMPPEQVNPDGSPVNQDDIPF